MVKRVKVERKSAHRPNGHFYGMWVHFDDDGVMYSAYRQGSGTKGYFRNKDAWCIDNFTLESAAAKGVKWITVLHDVSGFRKKGATPDRQYYGTLLEDFYGPLSGEHKVGVTKQRYLPRIFWRKNPLATFSATAKKVAIGRVSHS